MNDLKALTFEQILLQVECDRQVKSIPSSSSKEDQLKYMLKTIEFYTKTDPLNKIDLRNSGVSSKEILIHRIATSKIAETCTKALAMLDK